MAILAIPLQLAGDAANSGPLALAGQILADAISLSFAALAGTLLFFDLRARERGVPAAVEPGPLQGFDGAPERP